jgi:hypothetical protein
MKLEWLFGSSMAAHHLLWVYLSVWLIQGGYAAWIAWEWVRTKRDAGFPLDSETGEDY